MSAAIDETPKSPHEPWNKGRLIGQKRPLKPKEVWNIRVRLQIKAGRRDLAMFNVAIDSKLRGCDLVRLKIDDVYANGRARDRATVIQKKTGRPVQFELTEQARKSIEDWLASSIDSHGGRYLFPSRIRSREHISRQYSRIVHAWVRSAGLEDSAYGTHSMRRTKAAQIYQKTGNLRAVQLLLGHTKLESTVRDQASRSMTPSAFRSRLNHKALARPCLRARPRRHESHRAVLVRRRKAFTGELRA